MRVLTKKNEIVDQIIKHLKKSNMPLLSIDAEIARAQGKLAQWEEVGKNTRTERQNVNREECGVIRRMTLGNLIQEKREVVDTTMDLIVNRKKKYSDFGKMKCSKFGNKSAVFSGTILQ